MKILVIGDSCTDMFQYGKCERLSPEAPVPVFKPTNLRVNGGMAINVLENIKALDINCDIITNDIRPTKNRLVDQISNQIIVRIDNNDKIEKISNKQLNSINFIKYDAIVITDYNKGFLTEDIIKEISKTHSLIFMDSKKQLGSWAEEIEFIKINEKEYEKNYNWLINNYNKNLIVTKGKDGAVLNHNKEFKIENEHPVRDLSGAGDTFLAALVVKFLENNNINKAIKFANKCASWVVTQKGVTVLNLDKIK